MNLQQYDEIVRTISDFRGLSRDCSELLLEKYKDILPNTLYSILSQQWQTRMKQTHHRTFGNNRSYFNRYCEALDRQEPPGIVVRLAKELNTSPALLARSILEDYYRIQEENDIDNLENHKVSKSDISRFMKDTTLIKDGQLSCEVYLCILYDDQYGAISNAMQTSIGAEFEHKLERCLQNLQIPFYNEDYLREKGYDKTPDVKLAMPVAVDGIVVNWIESKAQFGSKEVHQRYTEQQYSSYWNRFGPGLVIYWFGYLDDIVEPDEKSFIVRGDFPDDIVQMNPDLLAKEFKWNTGEVKDQK